MAPNLKFFIAHFQKNHEKNRILKLYFRRWLRTRAVIQSFYLILIPSHKTRKWILRPVKHGHILWALLIVLHHLIRRQIRPHRWIINLLHSPIRHQIHEFLLMKTQMLCIFKQKSLWLQKLVLYKKWKNLLHPESFCNSVK